MPLEDYLLPMTEDEILTRMLAGIPDEYDVSEGSPIYDGLAPVATELTIHDDRLRLIMEWAFASTTFGEFLDLKVEEHGVTRNAAVAAIGTVTFTGTPGTVIPLGSEVSTPSTEGVPAQIYATDAEVTIPGGGSVDAAATAIAGGAEGNVGAGTVTIYPEIPGLTGVTNDDPMTGGVDEESDETLLERFLERVQNPGSSGNVADYKAWARSVAGVGDAAIVPLEDGPGTVTVAIVDADLGVPDAGLVSDVQEYIDPNPGMGEGAAPVGATVTVEGATAVAIDVVATLDVDPAYDEGDVQDAAEANIAAYLESLVFEDDNDVRHARVITAMLDTPGVVDATGVTIEGGTGNVVIGVKQIATLGTVTWS